MKKKRFFQEFFFDNRMGSLNIVYRGIMHKVSKTQNVFRDWKKNVSSEG